LGRVLNPLQRDGVAGVIGVDEGIEVAEGVAVFLKGADNGLAHGFLYAMVEASMRSYS